MRKIEIKKISCCGATEDLDAMDVVNFLVKNPNTEIGVSITEKRFVNGDARLKWICNIIHKLNNLNVPHGHIALHMNGKMPKIIAESGKLHSALEYIVALSKANSRVQLNFTDRNAKADLEGIKTLDNLFTLVEEFKPARFILPYDKNSDTLVTTLSRITPDFDVLYDSSYGLGRVADKYQSLFPKQLQGYCGGLSPENIISELDKIESSQTQKVKVWIDAESGLKDKEKNVLDLSRAQKFVDLVWSWQNESQSGDTAK